MKTYNKLAVKQAKITLKIQIFQINALFNILRTKMIILSKTKLRYGDFYLKIISKIRF